MIIVRHAKDGDMKYVSHKDTLRVLQRALKRAKIDVAYSQGFVPHMLTYTTTPLPLGVASKAEYFAVECKGIDEVSFLKAFTATVPHGLRGDWSVEVAKNPNLAYIVIASRYFISADGDLERVKEILASQEYVIQVTKKGETISKDVRNLIYDLEVVEDGIVAILATGNDNLRVDCFVDSLNARYGLSISRDDVTRVEQLVQGKDGLISVKEFLS